jgi:uncharacterized protein
MRPDAPHAKPSTIAIRVVPASSRTAVGGQRGDALVVRVTEAAVDGRATEAALAALARAVGVPRRAVSLCSGVTSRDKVVAIEAPAADVIDRLAELKAGGAPWSGRRG